MKKIPLTQGEFALIDDEDYPIVNILKWYACKDYHMFYARSYYMREKGKSKIVAMHRLIINAKPYEQVDHVDCDGLNNQKYNLRICSHSENQMNKKSQENSFSKFKGISWHKRNKYWTAQIKLEGKLFYLGYFKNEVDAARKYDEFAIKLFGEFARLNFPLNNEKELPFKDVLGFWG